MPRRRTTQARISANRRIARRHGFSLPVLAEPGLGAEVHDIARSIARSVAGAELDAHGHALACRVAEAMIDLRRVRLAKLPLIETVHADPTRARRPLAALARLDRYERRAMSRRNTAIYEFAAALRDTRSVMPAKAGIHVFAASPKQDVDARPSPGMTGETV